MPDLADRKGEMALLRKSLEDADKGRGRTVFLSGELGMGKSALCEAISEDAERMGFRVLRGWCYPEYMRPYLPVESALKSLKMAHLFQSSSPPRIERLFLISRSGILLTSVGKEEGMDGDIFTGMLTAVGHFVRDSMQMLGDEEGSLDVLGYGGMRILIEKGEFCSIAAVISGKENEYLIGDLQDALDRIHEEYGDVLRNWDSDMEKISGASEIMQAIIDSGKYEGIEYAEGDPKLIKGNIMENIALGVIRHSKKSPILLIIEDIQWADSSTLSIIQYLARNIRNHRIVVISTYRPEEIGENLESAIDSMLSESLVEITELKPIEEDALKEFLKGKIEDEEIAGKIAEESGGNPLFAMEMLNSFISTGEYRISRRIRDIVRVKMKSLSKDERDVAEASAVFGDDFAPSTIARMLDMRRIEVIKALKSMKRRGIIRENDGRYRFSTPKMREILYEGMGKDLAQAYHELAAEAIESERGSHEALGYHYFMAGVYDKAISNLMAAAEEAMGKYANDEAKVQLGYVLEATENGKWKEERARALEHLGEIYVREGRYGDAIVKFEEAMELNYGRKAEIMGKIARAYQQMGEYDKALEIIEGALSIAGASEKGNLLMLKGEVLYRKGKYDEAMDVLENALSILKENGEAKEIGDTIRAIGNIYFARGEYVKAKEFYGRALSTSEDISGRAMSLNNMGVVEVKLGNYEKAAEHFQEALKIRERMGDQWGIAMFLSNLGVVHSEAGDYREAMDYFQKSLKIRRKIGDRWGEAMSLNNIGMLHLDMGEYTDAVQYFKEALKIRESIGDKDGTATSMSTLGMAYTELGDLEKAIEMYEKALEIEEKLGDKGGMAEILSGMGRAKSLKGEYKKALELIERSLKICRETDNKRMIAHNLCCMMEISMEVGMDIPNSEEKIEELKGLVEELNSKEIMGWYLRILGLMEYRSGSMEPAMEKMKESLRIFEDMGRMGDVGKTLYWLGLIEGGDRGSEHVERAMEIFKKTGMKIWEKRVMSL